MTVTRERLVELVAYNPETGTFTNKVSRGGVAIGRVLGNLSPSGYLRISVDNTGYLAHRLAWLWVYGEFPPGGLDHKDGNRVNNRIENLRLAGPENNAANKIKQPFNTSGYKGVYWQKRARKWVATIRFRGKERYLGLFLDAREAARRYDQEAVILWGEYANTNAMDGLV